MSHVIRKPTFFSYAKTKDADQLHSYCANDHRFCFRYIDIPLLPKSKMSNLLAIFCNSAMGLCWTCRLETQKDRFSNEAVHMVSYWYSLKALCQCPFNKHHTLCFYAELTKIIFNYLSLYRPQNKVLGGFNVFSLSVIHSVIPSTF